MIISGLFSGNYINIFHKNGVQTNILRCLTCLNLNWIKSYDIKHIFFSFLEVFNFLRKKRGKFTPHKRPFYDHFWPFFCQLHRNLSQNWGSDGHFQVLNSSKSYLVQKKNMQKRKKLPEVVLKRPFTIRKVWGSVSIM